MGLVKTGPKGERGAGGPPDAWLTPRASQSGSELSSKLDSLSAEKDALSSAVRQREADLQAAQGLVREKEAALSQEQLRSSRERDALQGRLADKVAPRPPAPRDSWVQAVRSDRTSPGASVCSQGCASVP